VSDKVQGENESMESATPMPGSGWMRDDHRILADQADRFFAGEVAPGYEGFEAQGFVDRDIWTKAGAAGLLAPMVPEAHGGPGGDFGHDAVIIEAIGKAGCDGFGAALHSAIVAPYIIHYGSEEQKQRWLPKLVSGEYIGAIAMTEPGAGSDLQGVRTSAKRDGNHYVINGSKTFITNGQLANLIIVVTKTDPDKGAKGTSLFIIETDNCRRFQARTQSREGRAQGQRHVGAFLRQCEGPRRRPAGTGRRPRASFS
jgi:acyl-CoA dehydrogenase